MKIIKPDTTWLRIRDLSYNFNDTAGSTLRGDRAETGGGLGAYAVAAGPYQGKSITGNCA